MNLRIGVWSVMAAGLMFAAAGCGRASRGEKIRIAYLPITHAVVLEELAAAGELEIELVKYGSWPELLDALNTNRVDAASVLIQPAMKAREQGIPLTALALGHQSGNVVVVRKELREVSELRGRTLAIPHRASSHHILVRELLEQSGIGADEVKLIELAPPEMPSALASGRIAGYCVAEPFGAVAVAGGVGRVLRHSDELWPHAVCCALVAHASLLTDRPELAARLVAAYRRAGARLTAPERAQTAAHKLLRQNGDVLSLSMKWISFGELKLTREAYRELREKMVRYGISRQPPQFEDFVYSQD